MGWSTSATIKGITYNRGDYVTLTINSSAKHASSADGSGASTVSRNDHYFYGAYSATWDVTYPYHVGVTKGSADGRYYTAASFPNGTWTVTFNANGGSGAPSAQTKTYGSTLYLTSAQPTRTGYTFKNWNTNSGGTGTSYSSGGSYTSNSAVTLYAQWTANTYTISYNANGGSGAPSSHSYTYASSGTTSLSSTKPTRTGYTFLGWSLSADATSASYTAGGSFNKSTASNTTLYAVWKVNTYTITYDANGGSNAPNAQTYTYASSGTVALSTSIPTRTGYDFLGWDESSSATSPTYKSGTSWNLNVTKNTTLYAVWVRVESCTLMYDANGGECDISNQSHTRDSISTLSSVKPERKGYHFSGWSIIANARKATYLSGGKYINDDFADSDIITLYAVWRKTVDIHFRNNEL